VAVEAHDGSSWTPQAQMAYDGLGDRLSMTGFAGGQSVTTQYVMDGSRVLSADASGNVTTYLYGLGPIGQLTDVWAYGLPGCQSARVSITKPLTLTVQDTDGAPKAGLPVYVFTLSGTGSGAAYTGYHGTTDADGQTLFTLPQGDYRFRADYDGVQFWSSEGNSCSLPGCTQDTVRLPGGAGVGTVTIDYNYDPLYRLIAADYDTGDYFHYTYDAVGNRLTQENAVQGLPATTTYTYDGANRLTSVNGVTYTWDANGNLLSDGVNTYAYDAANRLTSFNGPSNTVGYGYNGLGDRLQETLNGQTANFTMDLNAGLTQALSDGNYDYLYGVSRLAQVDRGTQGTEYFLGDALGSVRQMTDETGEVTFAQAYDPYGVVAKTAGYSQTAYGFTNEYTNQGLVYLRSRMYSPATGRFLTKDSWQGDYNRPLSLNRWTYVEGNPVNNFDPTGQIPTPGEIAKGRQIYSCNCGWIDFGHANSALALSIINLLDEENKRFSTPNDEFRQDIFAVSPSTDISFWEMKKITVSLTAVVRTGLDDQTKDSVALGIYRNLQEKIEFTQGKAHEWFTYFSFEDLPSDEIGFYLAVKYGKVVNPASEGLEKNDTAWRYLAKVCGFPEDRPQAIVQSQQVYDSMTNPHGNTVLALLVNTPRVFTWGTPLLCELDGLCEGKQMHWPTEFSSIVPAQPRRNNLWWFYNSELDGELINIDDNSQFHYIKK
jgi:RHS repeat-associated protein